MASYPGAVKNFTSKNAGDTIQPAHINDLQDEVTALEAGLLNGTANLNSSNSTLANLSVVGGSTLTGNVHIVGNLQLDGTSTGIVATQPRVQVFHSTLQSIPDNTWTALTFDSEDTNPNGMHSTSSNPTRLTFAASSGWYLVWGGVVFSANSSGYRGLRVLMNGNQTVGTAAFVGSDTGTGLVVTQLFNATSTATYIELQAFQNTGASLNAGGASTNRHLQHQFGAHKVI
jgi:hypothetical protein